MKIIKRHTYKKKYVNYKTKLQSLYAMSKSFFIKQAGIVIFV